MTGSNVVVTGMGIVSAAGMDAESVWNAIVRGQSGLTTLTTLASSRWAAQPIGEIRADLTSLGAPRAGSRSFRLAWLAIAQGIEEAGWALDDADWMRGAGLILGATTGGIRGSEDALENWLVNAKLTPRALAWHECASTTDLCARRLGLEGPCSTVSTACSSGALAIAMAAEALLTGEADRMIAGGVDALSRLTLNGFNSLMLVDPAGCRPFDARRAGMNLGEGAAVLALELESHARKRGAPILARLSGWGTSCDAHHATAPHPEGEGARGAMVKALESARLLPREIGYINAHGTGTRDNDLTEARALRSVFGSSVPPFSSTKGYFGHTLAASGAIEAVVSILSLTNEQLPPSLGFVNVDPEIGLTPLTKLTPAKPRFVMSNSFGFGGNNVTLIFGKVEFSPRRKMDPPLNIGRVTRAVEDFGLVDEEIPGVERGSLIDEEPLSFAERLRAVNFPSEEDILDAIAADLGMVRINLAEVSFSASVIEELTPEQVTQYRVMPVKATAKEIWLALSDPSNLRAIDFLSRMLGKKINCMIASEGDLEKAIKKYYGPEHFSITDEGNAQHFYVCGLGVATAAGCRPEDLFSAAAGGHVERGRVAGATPLPEAGVIAYRCADLPEQEELEPNKRRRMNHLLKMAVIATRRARAASEQPPPPGERTAICLGTGLGCLTDTFDFLSNMVAEKESAPMPAKFIRSVHNAPAAQAAMEIDARGLNSSPTHREITFETALWQAIGELKSDRADRAYAGACDELSPYLVSAGRSLGWWSEDPGPIEPFKPRGEPLPTSQLSSTIGPRLGSHARPTPGEGAVVVSLSAELGDTVPPHALARVGCCALGRWRMDPSGKFDADSESAWIESTLRRNGVSLNEIDLLLTGANGRPELDVMYLRSHAALQTRARRPIPLATYKQLCGEFASASAVGFALAVGIVGGDFPWQALCVGREPSAPKPCRTVLLYTLSLGGSRAITSLQPVKGA